MSLVDAAIDTKRRIILYRDFTVEESNEGWEWTHAKYWSGVRVDGTCRTPFEAIEAVDAWYERETA